MSLIIQSLIKRFLIDPAFDYLTKLRLYNVECLDDIWSSTWKFCKKRQLLPILNDSVDICVWRDTSVSMDRLRAKT